jgi:hypothetical protein
MLPQYPNTRETATSDDEEFEVTQEADPWVRTPNWLLTRVPPAAVVAYCHLAARSPVRHSTSLVAQLSEWSGLSHATVKRSLSELERVGAVRWQ